ncbi:AraC-like DNA-binding protein [Desulfomicrobium macestii]|uniref:AraC-like DNA-binding protein n=1 Tax=Desulfomicrobium macestii TaxID=90731 RepID=A0ABR9H6B8_9BACT|nr:AraC family transcriptional regulator [Desulfomicrobium macestii]MBE1426259.1 AraC-like DNA-binding protein [Desulfomicrobium macestii]
MQKKTTIQNTQDDTQPTENKWFFEGFRVSFRDLATEAEDEILPTKDMNTCWMAICLNGDLRVSVTGAGNNDELCIPQGNCLLQYEPGKCLCNKCMREQQVQLLEIVCPAKDLQRLIGDTPLGHDLQAAMINGRPMHVHRPMTSSIRQALAGLRETISTGEQGSAPLVLSKTLEMVWHFTHSGGQDVSAQIPSETLRAVDRAKSILEANMENPPDLESLASQVGMSLSKLKQVFPMACGMPPYAYLRLLRMEMAMRLLRDEGRSVTETALEVGYSNLSHFSKTFVEHFGLKPSQARKSG